MFVYSGVYNVAAIIPDNPAVAWTLHKVSDRSVGARLADIRVPADLGKPELIKAGAVLFGENCVTCHGGPGLKPTAIAQGMNPEPPDLFRDGRDAAMDETFWFVRNGVKMTGMPGFGKTHPDSDIWALTAFLGAAPGMTPAMFSTQTGIAAPAPVTPSKGS